MFISTRKAVSITLRIIFVVLLGVLPIQFQTSISNSDWAQIIAPHITRSFLSEMFGYPLPRNVVILDSNITLDKLPKLEGVNWVLLSGSQIMDSAKQNGYVEFLKLSGFIKSSNFIRVVWEGDDERFIPRIQKIFTEAHVVETDNYYLTFNGWQRENSTILELLLLGPPPK